MNIKHLAFTQIILDGVAEKENAVPFFSIQIGPLKDLDLGGYFMLFNNSRLAVLVLHLLTTMATEIPAEVKKV